MNIGDVIASEKSLLKRDIRRSSDDGPISATNFDGQFVDESTVLLTYDTTRARRSSLWKLSDSRWQLVFHQGTALSDPGH